MMRMAVPEVDYINKNRAKFDTSQKRIRESDAPWKERLAFMEHEAYLGDGLGYKAPDGTYREYEEKPVAKYVNIDEFTAGLEKHIGHRLKEWGSTRYGNIGGAGGYAHITGRRYDKSEQDLMDYFFGYLEVILIFLITVLPIYQIISPSRHGFYYF